MALVKAYVCLTGCAATNSYAFALGLGSAAAVGGGVPPELLDNGAAVLLPWSGAEVVVGVGLGAGDAVGAETVGVIVPRFTVKQYAALGEPTNGLGEGS